MLFVRKNEYSKNRELKFISRGFESSILGSRVSKKIL
jgi:hypothetical protein